MCSKNYINEDNYIDDQNESHKTYKHIKKSKYHKKTGLDIKIGKMHKKLQKSYAFCRFMILTEPTLRLPLSENTGAGRVRVTFR